MELAQGRVEGEVTVVDLASWFLENRWRLIRWTVIGGAVGLLFAAFRPRLWASNASFIVESYEPGRSSLASFAGQFGVSLGSSQALTPEFYSRLVRSRVILGPVVRDSFFVTERGGGQWLSFFQIYGLDSTGSERSRTARAIRLLTRRLTTGLVRQVGMVEVGVSSPYASASAAVVGRILLGVNEFTKGTRQGQAGAERRFIELRVQEAADSLRASEDRFEAFLTRNKAITGSEMLTFQRDRLARDVTLKQQVFASLRQSYEDARIREVRDTPAITQVEPPNIPVEPVARLRVRTVLFGLIGGAFLGLTYSYFAGLLARLAARSDPEAQRLVAQLGVVWAELRNPRRLFRRGRG